MGACAVCQRRSADTSRALGLCADCAVADTPAARAHAARAHAEVRRRFDLPPRPPRAHAGVRCDRCINACKIDEGRVGYCGVRRNEGGRVVGGDASSAAVQWYYDPIPTNCVAEWVCPARSAAGYPQFTETEGTEYGCTNLAVFYEACSFDCLLCQNWQFKGHSIAGPRASAEQLADAVADHTRCICFFGGDPSCRIGHAVAASRLARRRKAGRILRICWETNGSMARASLQQMAKLSLESGGRIKFDLKAWDDSLHRALCGASNRVTLRNFEHLSGWIPRQPEPPILVAATLLVPGYVDARQVGRFARFIARLDVDIPYTLLAFHPAFVMGDLPITSRQHAMDCLAAAQDAGLRRLRIGNLHLLS
jgi:pyruvate formate lyase activating enzyme